jgi:hypothetical protein
MFEKIWEQEPDKFEFIDEVTGYKCLVIRDFVGKYLCGYVILPEDHIFYGKKFNKITIIDEELFKLKVHGGITHAGIMSWAKWNDNKAIITRDYAIGFDCGHILDLIPIYPATWEKGSYKTVEYVTDECKKLAKQLKKTDELAKKIPERIAKLSDEEKELMTKWDITEKDWVMAKESKEEDEDIEEYELIDAKEVIEDWLTKTAEVNPETVRILTRQIDQIKGKK